MHMLLHGHGPPLRCRTVRMVHLHRRLHTTCGQRPHTHLLLLHPAPRDEHSTRARRTHRPPIEGAGLVQTCSRDRLDQGACIPDRSKPRNGRGGRGRPRSHGDRAYTTGGHGALAARMNAARACSAGGSCACDAESASNAATLRAWAVAASASGPSPLLYAPTRANSWVWDAPRSPLHLSILHQSSFPLH